MNESYVSVESGTNVWDNFGDWLKIVESLGGKVLLIEAYDGDLRVWAQKEDWIPSQILSKLKEVKDDYEMEDDEKVFSLSANGKEIKL